MAGAVNIKFGANVGGFNSGVTQMQTGIAQFVTQAKSSFNGLGNVTAPVIAGLGDLNRQITVAKHQISDLVSSGKTVPKELLARYRGLQAASESVRQTLAQPVSGSAFSELNAKLSETKAKIQDLGASGQPIPKALTDEFHRLETQVKQINAAFDKPIATTAFGELNAKLAETKAKIQEVVASGGNVSPDLSNKLKQLQAQVAAVNSAVSPGTSVSGFAALNQRLSETKGKIQDLVATGQQVPRALMTEFRGLEDQVGQVGKAFEKLPSRAEKLSALGSSLQSFGRQASILAAGIALIGATSFKSYADINALQLGLQNITGSAAGAEARFKELMPVIKLPGLGLEEAVKGDVRLQAVGFSATTAKNALLQFGNAIALTGGGKFELDNVITQLTQMGSKARVLSEDLKPILTSSPAVAKAIKEMFGTVDSEQISAKLQATGRGPQDFIQDLIAKLSQLERVSGGPKNAIENLGDSIKIAQFEFGKAADNALGLTEKISGLGDFIGKVAAGFGNLSGGAQTAILAFAGIAAAVGPLALGLGSVIRVLPLIATGFSALISPVSLVIAAVAGLAVATVAVYNFNKAITSSYSSAKLLAEAHESVSGAIGGEIGRLSSLLAIARDETKSKEVRRKAIADINAISPEYLGNISLETVNLKSATTAIQDYTKALTLRASADYYSSKLAESQAKLAKENETSLKDRTSALDAFAARATTLSSYFGGQADAEAKLQETQKARAKQAQSDAQKEVDFNQRNLKLIIEQQAQLGVRNNVKPKPYDYSGANLGGTGIDKLKADIKVAKSAVDNFKLANPGKAVPAELLNNYKTLTARLKDATSATTKHREETYKTLTVLENLELTLKLVNAEIQEKRALGLDVPASTFKELDNITTAIRRVKGEAQIDLRLKPIGTSLISQNLQSEGDRISRFTDGLKARFDEIANAGTFGEINNQIAKIRENITKLTLKGDGLVIGSIDLIRLREYNAQLRRVQDAQDLTDVATNPANGGGGFFSSAGVSADAVAKMQQQIAGAKDAVNMSVSSIKAAMEAGRQQLKDAGVGLLTGIGESIGKGESPLKSALKSILDVLGNFVIQLGTALLFSSAALLAAAPLTFGITLAPGLSQQLAGAGLIIAGGAVKGFAATAFAQGGLVYGPTLGLVGEGVGTTKNNPEVIAPLDKLKSMIGGGGGTQVFIPDIQLEGSIIRIALNRADDDNSYYS